MPAKGKKGALNLEMNAWKPRAVHLNNYPNS